MSKAVLPILFLISCFTLSAGENKCASWTYLQRQFRDIPGFEAQFIEQERQLQAAIENLAGDRLQAGIIITIPVVIHVLYNAPAENISDAQIQSQLTVLNKDYRFLNSDKLASNHPFYPVAGDAEIEFCLATKDPSNNNTTGIIRKSTSVNGFTDDDKVKHNSSGGDDAWDPTKYLNIWVCKLKDDLLGYGTFPGGPQGNDGVVIAYDAFGTTEAAAVPPYNKGRTTTHEVGHWLALYHTWGDEDLCDDDDEIADTPKQAEATFGCPSGTLTDICQPSHPGIMYMNFMDYTDDACMNTYTKNQVTRMRTALSLQRSGILASNKCGTPSSVNNQQDRSVRIYPNPVTNYLFLENLPQTRQNKFQLQIIDELGRVIRETSYVNAAQQVEVSGLLNGYYVVRIFNDDFFAAEKILVLH